MIYICLVHQVINKLYLDLTNSNYSIIDDISTKSTSPSMGTIKNKQQLIHETSNYYKTNTLNYLTKNNPNQHFDHSMKKSLVERQGDWICNRCKNLNFSFRMICNRCKLPKFDSDISIEKQMQGILTKAIFNDFLQNQIINNNFYNMKMANIPNLMRSGVSNPNLFSDPCINPDNRYNWIKG